MKANEFIVESLESYGQYYNEERALPSITSGLKPVQLKILWGAKQLGMKNGKVKKGIVLSGATASYYVHGNAGLEAAIVRCGQNFKMTYPIISIQGNSGGQSNLTAKDSGAAALRYLECGITEIGEHLLASVKNGTAIMGRNFDNTADEPEQLFVPYPAFLLFNQKGIGVGTAISIPSFKKSSVMKVTELLIANGQITADELAEHLKPFYIQEATVINKSDFKEIYTHKPRDGKVASFKLRATFKASGDTLMVSNFPYDASPEIVINQIEAGIAKGKEVFKSIIRAQDTTCLDSKKQERVSMEFTLKPKTNIEELIMALCEYTSLQSFAPVNLVMLNEKGKPVEYSIQSALEDWLSIYKSKTIKRISYQLADEVSKEHILEGLIEALSEIDIIIELIKSSKDRNSAKDALMDRGYSELQSKAILDIKLVKLANLEFEELKNDLQKVKNEIDRLNLILSDDGSLKAEMIAETKKFTTADYAGSCSITDNTLPKYSATKNDKFYVVVSNGLAKITPNLPKEKKYATGDSKTPVMLFADDKIIPIKNSKVPTIASAWMTLGTSPVYHISKDGYIKGSEAEEFMVSKTAIATKQTEIIAVIESGLYTVTTSSNKQIKLDTSTFNTGGRVTKGLKIKSIPKGDTIISVTKQKEKR